VINIGFDDSAAIATAGNMADINTFSLASLLREKPLFRYWLQPTAEAATVATER
jgi:hypothetical protein